MTGIKYKTALMPLLLTALLSTTPAIHTDAAKNRKATTAKAEGTKAVKLLTENMKAPLGLGTRTPRFSWQIQSGKNSTIQTAYRILVASSREMLAEGKADLWDSGTVSSNEQLWIPYSGAKLKDNQRAYWTVRVTTNNGNSEWAEPQLFSTGIIGEEHWSGRWIGIDELDKGESMGFKTRVNARYLRTEIELEHGKKSSRQRLMWRHSDCTNCM